MARMNFARIISFGTAIALAAVGSPARADKMSGLISLDDYPADALARGEQGRVTVDLTIDPQGRVTGCKILVSAGWSIDRATCSLLARRARFTPAVDDNGNPKSDTYKATITWTIPGVRPSRPKDNSTRM